jgi:hypothetical protein
MCVCVQAAQKREIENKNLKGKVVPVLNELSTMP